MCRALCDTTRIIDFDRHLQYLVETQTNAKKFGGPSAPPSTHLSTALKLNTCLQLNQSVAEKLPSFVQLVSLFRKPINQHSGVSLILFICPWRLGGVPWLHGCGKNDRNVAV